ncbi:MAG: patatin-like phospholipase family protein [Gammaproteobacteria bacterium]
MKAKLKPMALILQGGGALGAFEYGVVSELVESGWYPKAVTGVSIGAVNAAAIAGAKGGDIVASLHGIWEAITLPQVPFMAPSIQANLSLLGNPNFWTSRTDYLNVMGWNSLCNTTPMLGTLARHLDFEQLNNPDHIRIGVTATDVQSGRLTTFSNYIDEAAHPRSGNHHSVHSALTPAHIMASGSLPPGFPATVVDGRAYWDGALFDNTPMDALLNMLEPEDIANPHFPIFTVDLFPTGDLPVPSNLVDVQTRTTTLQFQNRFWDEYGGSGGMQGFIDMLDELERVGKDSKLNEMPAFQWLMRQRALKQLQVIQGPTFVSGGDHDFSTYGVRQRYDAGREAAATHVRRMAQAGTLAKAA